MSRPLQASNVADLFKPLWNQKLRSFLENASVINLQENRVIEVIKREIEKFLRTYAYRELLNMRHDVKNNAKAAEIRNQGNKFFHPSVKRYIEAIKYYNESITYTEQGSEQRALAYSNRSIICMELHLYEDCLENIRLARESNFPERLAEKLNKREQDAKQALAKATENKKPNEGPAGHDNGPGEPELKLSYPAHENMPQVANCLQLQRNDQYGRYVVTTSPLKPGDIVMIDKPFATVLKDELRYVRCAHCYQEKTFILIPCERCTLAMYCSEECLSKAHQQYHRYECTIIRDFWQISVDVYVVALRTIALAIAAFDHDLEALKKHIDSLDESQVNPFTMDWKTATQKDIFDTIHVLTTNQHVRDRKNQAFHMFIATILHQLLLERTELGPICEVDVQMKKLLFDLILRHLQICQCNGQQLRFMDRTLRMDPYEIWFYATGCFPLTSMLNHSCAPNVNCITLRDGRNAVLVIRPIAEGGQLFMHYGPHHFTHGLQRRQAELEEVLCFRCRCEACQNDYPALLELPSTGIPDIEIMNDDNFNDDLDSHDAKKVVKWVPTLIAHIMKNDEKYPESELCNVLEQLERCFAILYSYTSKLPKYWEHCNP